MNRNYNTAIWHERTICAVGNGSWRNPPRTIALQMYLDPLKYTRKRDITLTIRYFEAKGRVETLDAGRSRLHMRGQIAIPSWVHLEKHNCISAKKEFTTQKVYIYIYFIEIILGLLPFPQTSRSPWNLFRKSCGSPSNRPRLHSIQTMTES